MRRDKNGRFVSNETIRTTGMKYAQEEKQMTMTEARDKGQAFLADFVRHLVDGGELVLGGLPGGDPPPGAVDRPGSPRQRHHGQRRGQAYRQCLHL